MRSYPFFSTLLLAVFCSLSGCRQQAESTTREAKLSLEELRNAIPSIDFGEADSVVREELQVAYDEVRADVHSPQAWGKLGMLLLAHDYFQAADEALRVAAELASEDAVWPYLRGKISILNVPDVSSALTHLNEALRRDPQDTWVRLELADLLAADGQLAEAERNYKQAFAIPPQPDAMVQARVHAGLGEIAVQRNDLTAARLHLEKSVQAADNIRATHALLAQVYFQQGEKAAAEEQQRLAAKLPSQFRWPDPYYEKVMSMQRGLKARMDYASSLSAQGRLQESIAFCEASAELYPNELAPLLTWGQQLLRVGNYEQAKEVFGRASESWPDSFDARFMLGVTHEGWGQPAKAAEHYAQAAAMQPNLAYAFARWGECLFKTQQLSAASEAFREAVRVAPNDAQSHKRLGQIAAMQEHYAEALEYFQNAQELAPNDAQLKQLITEAKQKQADR